MDQRLSLITLGVDDLARSRAFFERGLGWSPSTVAEGVCFYQLPGVGLALFGRDDLAEDARRPHQRTHLQNLALAGDYTQTGLPATIEGAIRSGFAAAVVVQAAQERT